MEIVLGGNENAEKRPGRRTHTQSPFTHTEAEFAWRGLESLKKSKHIRTFEFNDQWRGQLDHQVQPCIHPTAHQQHRRSPRDGKSGFFFVCRGSFTTSRDICADDVVPCEISNYGQNTSAIRPHTTAGYLYPSRRLN